MNSVVKDWWGNRSFLYEMEEGYYVVLHLGSTLFTWHSPFCTRDCVAPKMNSIYWWIDFGVEKDGRGNIEGIYGCFLGLEFTILRPYK
jgi:hypothetical protein